MPPIFSLVFSSYNQIYSSLSKLAPNQKNPPPEKSLSLLTSRLEKAPPLLTDPPYPTTTCSLLKLHDPSKISPNRKSVPFWFSLTGVQLPFHLSSTIVILWRPFRSRHVADPNPSTWQNELQVNEPQMGSTNMPLFDRAHKCKEYEYWSEKKVWIVSGMKWTLPKNKETLIGTPVKPGLTQAKERTPSL